MNAMTPPIVLTQMEISPFCDKVRRVLHYKGLPYTTREVKLIHLNFLKRMTPIGKVPALAYGGDRFFDSTDICLALEERHPSPALLPADPQQRADVLLLEDWADETLYFFEMTMRFDWPDDSAHWSRAIAARDWPLIRSLAPRLVPSAVRKQVRAQGVGLKDRQHLLRDLQRLLGALDTRISKGGYCVGDQLTLADISVAAQIHCIQGSGEGARVVDSFPTLADWKRRVDAATLPA